MKTAKAVRRAALAGLLLAWLASCTGCEAMGKSYGIEVESITPFTVSENTQLMLLMHQYEFGKPDKVVALNTQTMEVEGEIVFKMDEYSTYPWDVVAVGSRVWIVSGIYSNAKSDDKIIVVDAPSGRVEKVIEHDIENPWKLSYIPSLDRVLLGSGSTYDKGIPTGVFDASGEKYLGRRWTDRFTGEYQELDDGSQWCVNTDSSFTGNFYSFSLSTENVDISLRKEGAFSMGGYWNGFMYTMDGDNLVVASDGENDRIVVFNPNEPSDEYYIPVSLVNGVADEYCPCTLFYDSQSDRCFVDLSVRNLTEGQVAVLDRGMDGKWRQNISLQLTGYGINDLLMVKSGKVMMLHKDGSTGVATVEIRSTQGDIEILKTVGID